MYEELNKYEKFMLVEKRENSFHATVDGKNFGYKVLMPPRTTKNGRIREINYTKIQSKKDWVKFMNLTGMSSHKFYILAENTMKKHKIRKTSFINMVYCERLPSTAECIAIAEGMREITGKL